LQHHPFFLSVLIHNFIVVLDGKALVTRRVILVYTLCFEQAVAQ